MVFQCVFLHNCAMWKVVLQAIKKPRIDSRLVVLMVRPRGFEPLTYGLEVLSYYYYYLSFLAMLAMLVLFGSIVLNARCSFSFSRCAYLIVVVILECPNIC